MLRSRLLPTLACASLLVTGCSYFQAVPPEHRRAIVVSFDGAGERVIERMLDHGVMPHLARLRAEGAMADYSRTNFPSKTAAGHAALWTGAYGKVNGVTSNKVPAGRRVLDTLDGFSSETLLAEPIWTTAARAGKRVVVLQATHMAPFTPYAPTGRFGSSAGSLSLLDGYSGVRGADGVFNDAKAFHPAVDWRVPMPSSVRPIQEARVPFGDGALWALAYDDPKDGTQGYDTLRLYADKDQEPLGEIKPAGDRLGTPEGWSAPLPLATAKGPARSYFRLYDLSPSLERVLLYHTAPTQGQANRPEVAARYYGQAAFVSGGAIRQWDQGAFGPTMFTGGAGAAEARYLDSAAFAIHTNRQRARLAVASRDWDLLVSYMPFPDEALHAWYGAVDEQSPSYDARLAPVVWQRLEAVCRLADGYLGELMAGAGRDTVVAVASDHGMSGLKWRFTPNTVLRRAGLLKLDAKGNLDLAHTQVLYPATDGAYVIVNHVGREGGIVPANQVEAVLAKAQAALSQVQAHDGKPLVRAFLKPSAETEELALGGARGGDMYLDLQPGYYFDSDWRSDALFQPEGPGTGGHIFDPRRPDMHAIMGLWGPGVKHGAALGPVRNIDLAPTVCRLLGLPAPAQATGRVLTEALE